MGALLTNMNQVGLVVRDVKKAAAIFSEGFGLDLLNVRFGNMEGNPDFTDNTISIEQVYLDGQYIGTYGIEMAAVNFEGSAQLELIEPAGNRSLFQEFLEENGPGVHHIAVGNTCSFHEMIGRMAAAGNPLGQFARVDEDQEECAFIKHRYTLGLDIELHNRLSDFRLPEIEPGFIRADRKRFPKPLITGIAGINLVTNDLDQMITLLRDKYGLTDWSFEEAHMLKHAYCNELGVELQLLEPLDDSSGAAKWMNNHRRPGVCSVEFFCDGTDEDIAEALRRIGREPAKMFANKTGCNFEDVLGTALVFRAMK